jgi:hypothetical protein
MNEKDLRCIFLALQKYVKFYIIKILNNREGRVL